MSFDAAYQEAIHAEYDSLKRIALSVTQDEQLANDAVQNGAIKVIEEVGGGTLVDVKSIRARLRYHVYWAARTVRKKSYARLDDVSLDQPAGASGQNQLTIGSLLIDDKCETTETIASRKEQGAIIQKALTELEPKHREVIVLRHYEELTFAEIGVRLSIPEGTARSRYSTGCPELRRIVAKLLPEE